MAVLLQVSGFPHALNQFRQPLGQLGPPFGFQLVPQSHQRELGLLLGSFCPAHKMILTNLLIGHGLPPLLPAPITEQTWQQGE
jgi:hypothetical protein